MGSPLGVSWLAVLEAGPSGAQGWSPTTSNSDPASVAAAVDLIGKMSFGTLMDAAVFAGTFESGPWMGDAPAKIAAAYAQADRRTPIAEAVAERFGHELHAPLDETSQQWWTDGAPWTESRIPLFAGLHDVYGAGEFPWNGLWTAADPPPEVMVQMVGAWEYETGPITRWSLPVRPEARVFEIHRPADWARLVTAHPQPAAAHPGWELPGINQHLDDISPLLEITEQRAARASVRRHVVPDWQSVASCYDGIHLSWAGFITTEGCIVDLGGGDVTMLRYWFSERTLWLADVFGEPCAAPDPQIDFAVGHHWPPRPPRSTIDRQFLRRLLGRPNAS
jgi:hypothetical protein